jgi:hypothetical protein
MHGLFRLVLSFRPGRFLGLGLLQQGLALAQGLLQAVELLPILVQLPLVQGEGAVQLLELLLLAAQGLALEL